jgi:uncharacterized protein YjbI with pentapeptide repeats
MVNQEQLDQLRRGAETWNQWRREHNDVQIDFGGVHLEGAHLEGAHLEGAHLHHAHLRGAFLRGADLRGADLSDAHPEDVDLRDADLRGAFHRGATFIGSNLHGVHLNSANLIGANLSDANLEDADLRGVDLERAILVGTTLKRADLTGAAIYGISVWSVQLEDTIQSNLVITNALKNEPTVTVDNLEVAQFIYLLLNNPKIRDVIDTIAQKAVLILGRFTPERRVVLDALRDKLRQHDYLPIVFDFERPSSKDLTETVCILAHLSKFIILDLTDPSSAAHEAATIIPNTVVPVQPLLVQDDARYEYAMFRDLQQRHPWVLPTYRYQDANELLKSLQERVIAPAEQKVKELAQRK